MKLLAIAACATGCGTYSMVRSADTLPRGKLELAGGLAASSLEVNTVAHAAYGITDRVEVLAQNEVWSTIGEVRYGFLHSKSSPLGLAVGVGGGQAFTLLSAFSGNAAAASASIAVGRDFGRVTLTLGNREILMFGGYLASATRLGARLRMSEHFGLLLEAGATVHTKLSLGTALAVGEGTAGVYFGF
jgi:type IV secretory pathway TrbD component